MWKISYKDSTWCQDMCSSWSDGSQSLGNIIIEYMAGDYDVLIATTIIENGIDIPNTNTIIINQAQNYGLSDLHQLRGRVGRSNRKAYCYLIVPPMTSLSDDAKRRLDAIEAFSDLGSGFNIAMRDLDIRGMGNMLGAEQSGYIAEWASRHTSVSLRKHSRKSREQCPTCPDVRRRMKSMLRTVWLIRIWKYLYQIPISTSRRKDTSVQGTGFHFRRILASAVHSRYRRPFRSHSGGIQAAYLRCTSQDGGPRARI